MNKLIGCLALNALTALGSTNCSTESTPVAGLGAAISSASVDGGGAGSSDDRCGDGIIDRGEACDDGNLEDANRGQNPTFHECDGPEDCEQGVPCMGTRFGTACQADGYYRLCHFDADCDASRPVCDRSGICASIAACGDGVVDDEEDCDDGNTDDGDGCSSHCKRGDIATTAGDDRASFIACGERAVCGDGEGCCVEYDGNGIAGSTCAATREGCASGASFHSCDGPEDCDGGLACMTTRFGRSCGTGYQQVCHSSDDCDASRPRCNANGICES